MKSETITGSLLELVPPFARIMRAFFPGGKSKAVEPVEALKNKSDKRQDRPSTYYLKKDGRIEIKPNFRPGIEVDFYI